METTMTDKLVTLTESAQREVQRLINAEEKPNLGLRLGIKGGGCSGLSYVLISPNPRRATP